jgi:hypothetical protein
MELSSCSLPRRPRLRCRPAVGDDAAHEEADANRAPRPIIVIWPRVRLLCSPALRSTIVSYRSLRPQRHWTPRLMNVGSLPDKSPILSGYPDYSMSLPE